MRTSSKNKYFSQELSSSCLSQSAGLCYLDNQQNLKLNISYEHMKKFVQQVFDEQSFPLTQILEKYSGKQIHLNIISKNVIKFVEKRNQKMRKSRKIKKNWSSQDAQILYWTFCHYCHLNNIKYVQDALQEDWEKIAQLIPGSSADNCMFKILSLKKIKLSNQKWSQMEDQLLRDVVMRKKNKNWRQIAQQLYKRNENSKKVFRCAKQCKEHWFCYVNPQLKKGSWTLQQDYNLLSHVVNKKSSKKWSYLAKDFGGRTQNSLKNRYSLIIQRLRYQKPEQEQQKLVQDYLKILQRRTQNKNTTLNKKNRVISKDRQKLQQNQNQSQKQKQKTANSIQSKQQIQIKSNLKEKEQERQKNQMPQQNINQNMELILVPFGYVNDSMYKIPQHQQYSSNNNQGIRGSNNQINLNYVEPSNLFNIYYPQDQINYNYNSVQSMGVFNNIFNYPQSLYFNTFIDLNTNISPIINQNGCHAVENSQFMYPTGGYGQINIISDQLKIQEKQKEEQGNGQDASQQKPN